MNMAAPGKRTYSGPSFVLNNAPREISASILPWNPEEHGEVAAYFRSRADYAVTPLRSLPGYAEQLGVSELVVKDETHRLGLPAFKILGVAYAVHRLIAEKIIRSDSVLTCGTGGNHGRALAHVARQNGLRAVIYVHKGVIQWRVQAIAREGAEIRIVDGTYDDAVREAARDAEAHGWTLISDTAWPGYETIPRYVMAGYTMLMIEAASQWQAPPDVVFVQAGVGGLACAVAGWLMSECGLKRPKIITCEPESAACVLESIRTGRQSAATGSLETVMGGLNCAHMSSLAWPVLCATVDACVCVSDDAALDAVRKLAHPFPSDPRILAGESGACGIAGISRTFLHADAQPLREGLGLNRGSRIFAIITDGLKVADGAINGAE
jgi:diaminopropionate ammonia-lyase